MSSADFESLFNKRRHHIKPGLERIKKAWQFLWEAGLLPGLENQTPTVLVAGTNGKGSTSGFLWQLLESQQITTGCYTSPHLIDFRERYLCRSPVTDEEIVQLLEGLKALLVRNQADLYQELTFFEIATLLALMIFHSRRVATQILEVGLGGRLDATNLGIHKVCGIVSIGLDHQEYLGHDLAAIGAEKAGVIQDNNLLVTGEIKSPAVNQVIANKVAATKSEWWRWGQDFGLAEGAISYYFHDEVFDLPPQLHTAADYLKHNFITAEALRRAALKRYPLQPRSEADLRQEWLHRVPSLWGRGQKLWVTQAATTRQVILDVCHNQDGVQQLRRRLIQRTQEGERFAGMMSVLMDKPMDNMIADLRGILEPLMLFSIDDSRSAMERSHLHQQGDLQLFARFEQAWDQWCTMPDSEQVPLVICGSVLATGRVLQYFLQAEDISIDHQAPSQDSLSRSSDMFGSKLQWW